MKKLKEQGPDKLGLGTREEGSELAQMMPSDICRELEAAKRLAERRVQALLPVGTVVIVAFSRGPVRLKITGYCWDDPLRVRGVNTATAKRRDMVVGYDDFEIVMPPPSKQGGAR
jgi:hypothetical protein